MVFKLQSGHIFCDGQSFKGNNSNSINASIMVLVLCMSSILIDIYMKFHEDSLNGFEVIEQTRFCDRQSSKENNSKSIKQELWFLCSTSCLMLIDIYMKFREDSFNGFQVIERTRFCDRQTYRQSSNGNNLKSINARVMVLALCTLSVDWYLYEVLWR